MAVIRPAGEHVERLRRVADAHREWELANLGEAGFHERGPGSDYNQHHLDIEAPAAAQARFHATVASILRT